MNKIENNKKSNETRNPKLTKKWDRLKISLDNEIKWIYGHLEFPEIFPEGTDYTKFVLKKYIILAYIFDYLQCIYGDTTLNIHDLSTGIIAYYF